MNLHDAKQVSILLHNKGLTTWIRMTSNDNYVCQFIHDRKLYTIDESIKTLFS